MSRAGKPKRDRDLREYIAKLYGDELEKANTEIARLRKILDDRPHDKGCRYVLGTGPCKCWKAEIAAPPNRDLTSAAKRVSTTAQTKQQTQTTN